MKIAFAETAKCLRIGAAMSFLTSQTSVPLKKKGRTEAEGSVSSQLWDELYLSPHGNKAVPAAMVVTVHPGRGFPPGCLVYFQPGGDTSVSPSRQRSSAFLPPRSPSSFLLPPLSEQQLSCSAPGRKWLFQRDLCFLELISFT